MADEEITMKKIWLVGAGCLLVVSLLFSCTTKNLEKESEALYPDDHLLQDDLGLAYYYKGEQDLAIRHFKKALALKDDYMPARNNLGNAYAEKREWDKAIEQYEVVSSDLLYATPYYPLSNLGFAYYQKKEYDLSEKYYLKALKLRRDFVRALQGLAKTYMATGRVLEAIDRLEKAIEISPEAASVYFDLAKAYSLNRDFKKAYALYHKVVELIPDSPLADKAMEEARKIERLY